MNTKLISAFLALALASMACGFELPKAPAPEPEVTENMSVPAPDGDQVNLKLAFGAGELSLAPGSSQLVVHSHL